MKLLNILNKTIEYSFYLLFFLVPLALTGDTSELFEFNKLWITFIIAIVIGVAWVWKMIIKGKFSIQRTPLDIPIGIFLVSEIISTFISLDTHTSLWGYYSRFNGGLFSILAYIFLFYAFVSNLKEENESGEEHTFDVKKIYIFIAGIVVFFAGTLVASQIPASQSAGIPFQMLATLIAALASFAVLMKAAPTGILQRSIYAILSSCAIVVLWGLPSHFGYDPTCLLFRGKLDVSCWTTDFQPKIRIFSTLGQPDWLGAYLAALLPLIAAISINFSKGKTFWNKKLSSILNTNSLILLAYFAFFVLSFLAFLYSQSKSAVIAGWIMIPVFIIAYFWFYQKPKFDKKNVKLDFKVALILLISVFAITFFAGQPISKLQKFTLQGIVANLQTLTTHKASSSKSASNSVPAAATELGGTDSGTIRLLVWEGAINIWKANPIFGTGVETFAYAYYMYRPAAHNLTSEWQYLYNKAHNEYLNYLATTGTVGIIGYLSMIGMFLFVSLKHLFEKRNKLSQNDVLIGGILAGYGTILITNFFGFSVVMINILFYLSPAFVFLLAKKLDYDKQYSFSFSKTESVILSTPRKISLGVVLIIGGFMIYTLITYWQADRLYYFGYNYDHSAGDYQKAYPFLKDAVDLRPSEPVFRDEFAFNNAILGASILAQLQQQKSNNQQNLQIAKQLIETAITQTNQVTTEHPNNVVFWKTKVRVYYTLGQIDPSYLTDALAAIKKAHELAPTDADVSYNLGILYGQTGNANDAIKTLQDTIVLKKDYFNAYYALGIFYHQLAVDQKGVIVNKVYAQKAIDEMKLIIKLFGPNQQVQQALNAWSKM